MTGEQSNGTGKMGQNSKQQSSTHLREAGRRVMAEDNISSSKQNSNQQNEPSFAADQRKSKDSKSKKTTRQPMTRQEMNKQLMQIQNKQRPQMHLKNGKLVLSQK